MREAPKTVRGSTTHGRPAHRPSSGRVFTECGRPNWKYTLGPRYVPLSRHITGIPVPGSRDPRLFSPRLLGGGQEVVFAAAKQSRHPRTRGFGPSFITFAGLVLAAIGLAAMALALLTGTTLAQSASTSQAADVPRKLGSLKSVS